MNLPFKTVPKQKDAREVADSGLLIWRENFINFIPFFAIPFWICAFALRFLPGNMQYFSWLILWMFRPLFDRIILHIISVRFFESSAGIKRLLHGLGKSLLRGLAGDLLWRRFSPLRSAMMPVRVLEPRKKSGKENAQRRKLLKNGGINFCFFLTLWGIAVEITLLFGEIIFFMLMADLFTNAGISFTGEFWEKAEIYIFAAWCINYIIIETIYVCMGFSLYISSRINVEGWDLEIMFRGFAEKLKSKKTAGVLVVLCLVCLLFPVNIFALDLQNDTTEVPLEILQDILDSPDFGGEKDSWGIRFKNEHEPKNNFNFDINPIMEKLRIIFAFILRFILIMLIAAFAVFLFLYARKLVNERNNAAKKTAASVLRGIPLLNPDDLLEKAAYFFEHENLRLAWGYCTAAAILSWSLYRGLVFPPNATESDCAGMVKSMTADNPDEAGAFCSLINDWVSFAYAGQLPPAGHFEEAAAFCKLLRTANG
ncbi:MAG: hypothetical protein FWF68_08465 [Spirochaetes bacterium]|nr:hypothetical protein [Spirochaetota bacterium]